MQHIAHGPPSSTKPNPFRSAGRQTSHLLSVQLLGFVVRFSSRGLTPHITLSQSYLTHDYLISSHLQDWPYVHMGSAHVCTRYLYIYMCVRMKLLSFGKAPPLLFANSLQYHIVGIAFFIVFGSQRDVLRVWSFWRKDETTTRSATTDSGVLMFEDPMILGDKRSQPDTKETHGVRPPPGSSPFSLLLQKPFRAHSAVEKFAGHRVSGTDRLGSLPDYRRVPSAGSRGGIILMR